MKGFIVLSLFALASANAEYLVPDPNYHENVGIPLAEETKRAEQAADFDGSRIVGGSAAGLGTHPHLAATIITLTTGSNSLCGSSLVSHTRSLTAAHCWRTRSAQARSFTLAFGTTQVWSGGVRVFSNNIQMHPNYDMDRVQNDIAVVVHGWVGYTNVIQPIFLPPGHLLGNQFVGLWAWAAGFGRTSDASAANTAKHQVAIQVISNAECSRTWGGTIIASTLCVSTAGGRGTCRGDSGGPLAFTYGGRRTIIGVTSFGGSRCQAGEPAGFARVTSFVPWIQSRM